MQWVIMPGGRHTNAGSLHRWPEQSIYEMQDKLEIQSQASSGAARERLCDYDRMRLNLASLIQSVFRLISQKTDHGAYEQCRDLLEGLAEYRFTLAVVGQFNRGKSSLMNAVMGLDRLPVGIVPLTSVITKVSYGNPERVLIEFRGWSLKDEIPLERLAEYVTETGNPGNQKQITAAEVQLPSEFLRRGLFFVDTPGIGSAIEANTATTEQFLPQADAVIFVTSFDSPLGQGELDFLQKVRENVRKIFLVVNKSDLVTPPQRDQVLGFIRQHLKNEVGLREARIFAVSALVGLEAKISGSDDKLVESGLPGFEENLVEFLTTEKTAEFLLRMSERALLLLGGLRSDTSNSEHESTLNDLTGRLLQLREELSGGLQEKDQHAIATGLEIKPRSEAELMDAVRQPCQVCSIVADAMMKFMAKFQYQIFANESERTVLARRGGLCPLHTWQYAEVASPHGISASYPQVLKELSGRLSDLARFEAPGSLNDRARRLMTWPQKCRACREQAAAEEKVLDEILATLNASNNQQSPKFPVLCLAHLSALLKKLPDENLARELLDFEAALFERLAENMERYALRHDALRRNLNSSDERVAYHRGLSQLVGDKRLQAPWHVERLV